MPGTRAREGYLLRTVGGTAPSTGGAVRPLEDLRPADAPDAGWSAVALARLHRAGLPVREGFVVVPEALRELDAAAAAPGPPRRPPAADALALAYAGLGIEDAGGARVVVRPVLGPDDPLPARRPDVVRGAPAVRAQLLALRRGPGAGRPALVQVASPPAQRTGWAHETGTAPGGPVLVVETGPFTGPSGRPPVPGLLREVARLVHRVRSVLGRPCDVGWGAVGTAVHLTAVRPRTAATTPR
jgi:hypothetical protein